MKDHYDICVAGLWYGYNYGSLLNGYAEYRLLKDMGKEVLMLQKPGAKKDDPEITSGHNTRFVKKYYDEDDISPVLSYDKLKDLNQICDCFCAGSDQIWNYSLSFGENMYLPFVHDDKRRISFATSFGHRRDNTPDEAKDRVKKYLERFHAISFREKFDVDILAQNYSVKGTLLFDPVFCLEKKVYEDIAKESAIEEQEPYLLAYIVDPTPEKREAILYYAHSMNTKAIVILDGSEPAWEHNRQSMDLPNILSNIGVEDFLKIYMNASFIITDSFHGAAFSIIFNKSFICIGNYGRGMECFVDLFERLELKDRLVTDPLNIPLNIQYLQPIEYADVNQNIEKEKNATIKWLKWAIESPLEDLPPINVEKKDLKEMKTKRVVDENGLRIIKNVYDYFEELNKVRDALIIVSVKDTAGPWLDDILQEKIFRIGLKESLIKKFQVGYIAVIKNGVSLFEEMTEKLGKLKYEARIDNLDISVTSFPLADGNDLSIRINGIDYATNLRGLNIVIYDLKDRSLIDSVAFDTHVKELTCQRKTSYLKEHYDVGVVGVWKGWNYGSVLNGYAVYKTLKKMNKSVLLIHESVRKKVKLNSFVTHTDRFIEKFYPEEDVSPIIPYTKLNILNNYCDTFLSGSDQIWNFYLNRDSHMTYMLNFADDSKKKLSFCTSFGKATNNTPREFLPEITDLLKRYQAISVREKAGADICMDSYGLKAKVLIEPVFCLTVNEYSEIANESQIKIPLKPYILTYILDPTEEKRNAILNYIDLTGMEIINILDGDPRGHDEKKKILNLPNILDDVGEEDLICLYMNASFVISDSFHGTAFAIIFNKPFLSILNEGRGSIRFYDILRRFDLMDHLAEDASSIPIDEKFLATIDYSKINQKIYEERNNTIDWLRWVIDTPKDSLPDTEVPTNAVTSLLEKKKCMGCGACVCTCLFDALSLQADQLGYYRSEIDYDKCINCGKCSSACPALNLPEKRNSKKPECFAFTVADKQVLYNSSSGGVFALLAEEAFQKNGRVVGAAWRDDFSVEHIIIEEKSDLYKLQKSKYLQSYLGKTFFDIKELLDNDIFVLFSGCPCQVAGLKKYLGKDYENLILVDLLCGNSPSTMFFQKYLIDAFPEGVKKYGFRDKVRGWNCDCVTVAVTDGSKKVRRGGSEDAYQRVYHNHTMCPPHCEKCKYQEVPRFGDLTIGDFWGISKKDPQIDSSEGVSVVLCNNEKGKSFFNAIPESDVKMRKKVPLQWLGGNGYAINGSHNYCSPQRDSFYKAILTKGFQNATNYALKPNHGQYPSVCKESNTPLQFASSFTQFRFDLAVWEEHIINSMIYLMVKPGMSKVGRYAVMPLCQLLNENQEYLLAVRFRIKTKSNVINFHIKDSGTNCYQVIYSYKIKENYNSEEWIEIESKFRPKSNIYDEFMIGASQISGPDNYICFDYINIRNIKY